MPNLQVHIVDDDPDYLTSLVYMLESEALDLHTYSSASQFLHRLDEKTPFVGIVVSDIRMPKMSGIELQVEIVKRHCLAPVIFMTAHGDIALAVQAMRRGAADFIEKPFPAERLIESIRQTAAAFPDVMRRVNARASAGGTVEIADFDIMKRIESLSPREHEVLDCVLQGVLNKQMASQLNISIKTIEMHRANMMSKMNAKSLPDLVRMTVGYLPQPAVTSGS
jgi:two-component system, LuxR family, response regulator FixJ